MARAWAKERKIDVIQAVYSLLDCESTELVDDLGSAGIGVFARGLLVNGFLSGSLGRDSTFTPETLNARYTREEIEARVERVEALSFLVRDPVENMAQAAAVSELHQQADPRRVVEHYAEERDDVGVLDLVERAELAS